MEQVAMGWLVLSKTDSPFMVGVAAAAGMAPFFFLGILSGAIADRVDRRLVLRFVILGGSLVAGLMAFLLLTEVARIWHIIALAAAAGSLKAFFGTMSQAYAYDIVGPERALNGLAMMSVSHRVGALAGALASGLIISAVGVGGQYVVIGGTYILGVGVLLGTRDVGQAAIAGRESVLRNLLGYVELLRGNRTLLILMYLAATTEVFGFTHSTLLPVFARDVLDVGTVELGIMTAANQAGGLVGLMFLANLRGISRKGLYMFAASTSFGLGLMAFSISENFILFLVVLGVVNACASIVDTLYKTLMQSNVANEQRGRAMGSWVLSIGTAPAGHLGVGGVAGALGPQRALLINGGILAFINLASAVGLPRIRRLV
jgi:MFS family permease